MSKKTRTKKNGRTKKIKPSATVMLTARDPFVLKAGAKEA